MNHELFGDYEFGTAADLVGALSAAHDMWRSTGGIWDQNEGSRNWVFRGQQSAEWRLVPAAFRNPAFWVRNIGIKAPLVPKTVEEQLEFEREAVGWFFRAAIRAGMALPEDSQWFRNADLIKGAFDQGPLDQLANGINFPFVLERSLYALAQHHGVPTRLLDWTESPLVAAYFAAIEAARAVKERQGTLQRARGADVLPNNKTREESLATCEKDLADTGMRRLAVWSLRKLAVLDIRQAQNKDGFDPVIEWVEAPYAGNPNLQAQRGLFTLVRHFRRVEALPFPTIEEVIESYAVAYSGRLHGPWLRRLTLPWSEAPSLLRILDGFNINAAVLFPGYDGVLRAIEERVFWA